MDGLTLPQQALICLTYGVTLVCSGLALYGTARRFLTVRSLGMGKGHPFPDVWYLHRHGDLGWRS